MSGPMLDRERLRAALAGLKGQPIEPISPLPRLAERPFAPAAVLVPIVERPQPGLILTRRRDGLRRHAGEISFPGGRLDPCDADEVACALREAHEEIALPPAAVEVLGRLDPIIVGTGYIVTPVVGVVPPDLPLVAQEDEVAGILEAPLAHVASPAHQRLETAHFAGQERSFYVIDWADVRIWGATARMLVELGKRLA